MTNQTTLREELVALTSGRALESKLTDLTSALDHGAVSTNTASANTSAINAAIQAAILSKSGFVLVPNGISYTEASLVMDDSVVLIVFGGSAAVTFLTKNQGDAVGNKGGVVIKSQGDTGVLLKASDYGVTAEPVIQFCDATTGDVAAVESKWTEMQEITEPTAPGANKVRLYCRDNGSGKTQLVARFPTGAVQQVAIEP